MKSAILLLALWTVAAWGQQTARQVWVEEPRATGGQLAYRLRIDDWSEVLTIEADVLVGGGQAAAAQVRQTALLYGFVGVSNVVGNTVKIAIARAIATGGGGRFAEVVIPESDPAPELGLVRVTLNSGQIPVEYEKVEQAVNPGDFDADGEVGFVDFFLFADHFGQSEGDSNFDPFYDLDRDGIIGFLDFFFFADLFGTSYR